MTTRSWSSTATDISAALAAHQRRACLLHATSAVADEARSCRGLPGAERRLQRPLRRLPRQRLLLADLTIARHDHVYRLGGRRGSSASARRSARRRRRTSRGEFLFDTVRDDDRRLGVERAGEHASSSPAATPSRRAARYVRHRFLPALRADLRAAPSAPSSRTSPCRAPGGRRRSTCGATTVRRSSEEPPGSPGDARAQAGARVPAPLDAHRRHPVVLLGGRGGRRVSGRSLRQHSAAGTAVSISSPRSRCSRRVSRGSSVTPTAGARETYYTATYSEDRSILVDEPSRADYVTGGVSIVGPSFSRVWLGDGGRSSTSSSRGSSTATSPTRATCRAFRCSTRRTPCW